MSTLAATRELIHLLSGENLLKARFLRRSVKTPIIASPLIKLIDELLRRGEREGDFRRGIDPLQLYVTMVGFAYFHRSNAYTLSVIFQSDLLAPAWQAAHKRYCQGDDLALSATRSCLIATVFFSIGCINPVQDAALSIAVTEPLNWLATQNSFAFSVGFAIRKPAGMQLARSLLVNKHLLMRR